MGLKKAQNTVVYSKTSRRFEALRLDYDRITGPRRVATFTRTTPIDTTYNRVILSPNNNPPNLSYIKREYVTEGAGIIDQYLTDAIIEDSTLEVVVKNNNYWLNMRHWRSEPTIGAQAQTGAYSATGGGLGRFEYGYVMPIADAMYVGSRYGQPRATARYCRLTGRGFGVCTGLTYGGGLPGTPEALGPYMTIEQCRTTLPFTPGMTVQAGQFVQSKIASVNDGRFYQCIQSGTVSTSTTLPVWTPTAYSTLSSGDTSQPFTDGTAKFICVGAASHSDALQWVGGGYADIYRCYIDGSPNAALIIESWVTSAGDGQNAPARSIITKECTIVVPRTDGIYCYVGSKIIDPNDGFQSGGLSYTSGLWQDHSLAYRSIPWGIQWISNTWLDQPGNRRPVDAKTMVQARGPVFVSSPERWKQVVANQFNLSVVNDATLLDSMLDGTIDWNSFMSSVSINQSVLNARKAMGLTYGACDMRTAHIWVDNRNQIGELIHPSSWANFSSSFDSNGYYIGN